MHVHDLPDGFLQHQEFIGMSKTLRGLIIAGRRLGQARVPVAEVASETKHTVVTADGYLRRLAGWGIVETDDRRTWWFPGGEKPSQGSVQEKPSQGSSVQDEAKAVAARLDAEWFPGKDEPNIRADIELLEELTHAIHRGHTPEDLFMMFRPRNNDLEHIDMPTRFVRSKLMKLRAFDDNGHSSDSARDDALPF